MRDMILCAVIFLTIGCGMAEGVIELLFSVVGL